MKHTSARLIILVLLMLMLSLPVLAQDPTAEATDSTPVTVTTGEGGNVDITVEAPETAEPVARQQDPLNSLLVIVLAVLLSGSQVYGAYLTRLLSKFVPLETAQSIYQSGVRFGYETALNRAALTPNTDDDEYYIKEATARGYQVVKRTDGSYQVSVPAKSTAPVNLPLPGASTTSPSSGS